MEKRTPVVVFTRNNARMLYVEESEIPHYIAQHNSVVNPDLSSVQGIPPHFWKPQGQKIVEKSPLEKAETLESHEKFGVHNDHLVLVPNKKPLISWYAQRLWATFVAGFGLGVLVECLLRRFL